MKFFGDGGTHKASYLTVQPALSTAPLQNGIVFMVGQFIQMTAVLVFLATQNSSTTQLKGLEEEFMPMAPTLLSQALPCLS